MSWKAKAIIVIWVAAGLLVFYENLYTRVTSQPKPIEVKMTPVPTGLTKPVSPTPVRLVGSSLIEGVAFTVQAPLGEWKDHRQQDGCEEAVALMARCSVLSDQCSVVDGVIDKIWAKEEMLKMYEWEVKNFGGGIDTSAKDTAERLLGQYLGINGYMVVELNSLEELIFRLMDGNLVIAPMNGKALKNPHFTGEGPDKHMLVVRGYDADANEVIVNDPGFRQGRMYRYPAGVFWRAIRDYPTGNHEPIEGELKRVILIKMSRQ